MAKQKKPNVIATFASTCKKLAELAGSQGNVGDGKGVKQRTLSRWAKGGDGANPRLSKIQDLATSLGVEAWQILVPGFDPAHLPELAGERVDGHNIGTHEVNFILSLRRLPPRDRAIVLATLASAIEQEVATPKQPA